MDSLFLLMLYIFIFIVSLIIGTLIIEAVLWVKETRKWRANKTKRTL